MTEQKAGLSCWDTLVGCFVNLPMSVKDSEARKEESPGLYTSRFGPEAPCDCPQDHLASCKGSYLQLPLLLAMH